MTLFNFDKKADGAFKNLVFTNSKEKRSNDKFYSSAPCYTRRRNTNRHLLSSGGFRGGGMGGMHPPHQPKHNVHMHNIKH